MNFARRMPQGVIHGFRLRCNALDKICRPGMPLMTLITFYTSRFDVCIHCHNTPFTSDGVKKERHLCVQFSRLKYAHGSITTFFSDAV